MSCRSRTFWDSIILSCIKHYITFFPIFNITSSTNWGFHKYASHYICALQLRNISNLRIIRSTTSIIPYKNYHQCYHNTNIFQSLISHLTRTGAAVFLRWMETQKNETLTSSKIKMERNGRVPCEKSTPFDRRRAKICFGSKIMTISAKNKARQNTMAFIIVLWKRANSLAARQPEALVVLKRRVECHVFSFDWSVFVRGRRIGQSDGGLYCILDWVVCKIIWLISCLIFYWL